MRYKNMILLPAATINIYVGTNPPEPILDPGVVAVGDTRWFRDGTPGQLSLRRMRGAIRVKVTDLGEGTIFVDTVATEG